MNRLFNRKTLVRLSIAAVAIAGCAITSSMTNNREETGPKRITLSYLTTIADANAEAHCEALVPQECSGDGAGCFYETKDPVTGTWVYVASTLCRQ